MSKIVEVRSQEQFEQLLRSSKMVLVDFWAERCGPCKVIAPRFEKLAETWARANTITFAKIDNDKNQNIADRYQVSALPTIILFEDGKETRRFKDFIMHDLIQLANRFQQVASSAWAKSERGNADITSEVDLLGIELLNSDSNLGSAPILFSEQNPSGEASTVDKGNGKSLGDTVDADWIESDTDAQLMLFIPFQSKVKVHSLHITSCSPRAFDNDNNDDEIPTQPRRIDIYTNRSHNLGFEEADDMPAVQTIQLKPEDWNAQSNTAILETRFVKFQNVSSLVLFFVDAQGDAEKTRVDRIRIMGEIGEKRTMGKLNIIGDEPGE